MTPIWDPVTAEAKEETTAEVVTSETPPQQKENEFCFMPPVLHQSGMREVARAQPLVRQVALVIVCNPQTGQLLQVLHERAQKDGHNYGCVQGEIETNESLIGAATRELYAETSLQPADLLVNADGTAVQYCGSMLLPLAAHSKKRQQGVTHQNFHCGIIWTKQTAVEPAWPNVEAKWFMLNDFHWLLQFSSPYKQRLIIEALQAAVQQDLLSGARFGRMVHELRNVFE